MQVPAEALNALTLVKPGNRVFVDGAAAAPQTLIAALVARADDLRAAPSDRGIVPAGRS